MWQWNTVVSNYFNYKQCPGFEMHFSEATQKMMKPLGGLEEKSIQLIVFSTYFYISVIFHFLPWAILSNLLESLGSYETFTN